MGISYRLSSVPGTKAATGNKRYMVLDHRKLMAMVAQSLTFDMEQFYSWT